MTVPGYWRNETSGVLVPVVEKYLRGAALEADELAVMRRYLRQWVDAFPGMDALTLRTELDGIHSTAALREWMRRALDAGIDPL